jgi:hypothetical protein
VFTPESVHCPGPCGADIPRDVIMEKLGLKLHTCSLCKGQTEYVKKFRCARRCECCFSCEINLRGNESTEPCPICILRKNDGFVCCKDPRASGTVTNIEPCGHIAHIDCMKRYKNRCPRCDQLPNRI